MKLRKATIKNYEFAKLSENERIIFVQIGHFFNEINILQKMLLYAINSLHSASTFLEKDIYSKQAIFVMTMLGSKLSEGWQFLQASFFGAKISKLYEVRLNKRTHSLNELKNFFSGSRDNLLNIIRNKYAYHYDRNKIKNEILKMHSDLEILFSDYAAADDFYTCCDDVFLHSIIKDVVKVAISQRRVAFEEARLKTEDAKSKLLGDFVKILVDDTLNVCKSFQEFSNNLIALLCEKIEIDYEEVKIPEPPNINDVNLPFFIKRNE